MSFDRNAIAFGLIAGRHRLEAARSLGWSEIPATVAAFDDVDHMLAEIDENLIRNELSDLERAEHLQARERVYVEKHPDAAPVAIRGGPGRGNKTSAESAPVSFAADTAAKTGRSERSIQVETQIANHIPEDVRDAIRETPIADSKADLLAMASKRIGASVEVGARSADRMRRAR